MNSGHWHHATCEDCGTIVLTKQNGGHAILCAECNHKRRLDRNHQYDIRRRGKSKKDIYIANPSGLRIVKDPLPPELGGFPCGNIVTRIENQFPLEFGNYTLGTILADENGNQFIVVRKRQHQELKPCPSG